MGIVALKFNDFEDVMNLFIDYKLDGNEYKVLLEKGLTRDTIRKDYSSIIKKCLYDGDCFGWVENDKLQSVMLAVDATFWDDVYQSYLKTALEVFPDCNNIDYDDISAEAYSEDTCMLVLQIFRAPGDTVSRKREFLETLMDLYCKSGPIAMQSMSQDDTALLRSLNFVKSGYDTDNVYLWKAEEDD